MKRKRFTEEQIAYALRHAETGHGLMAPAVNREWSDCSQLDVLTTCHSRTCSFFLIRHNSAILW